MESTSKLPWVDTISKQLCTTSNPKIIEINRNQSNPLEFVIKWLKEDRSECITKVTILPEKSKLHFLNGNPHYIATVEELLPEIFHHCGGG